MFRTQKVNNEVVVPPVIKDFDIKQVKGAALFPEVFSNVFLCARKQSGKSSVLLHILKKCVSTPTKVWIFCGTHDIDDVWIEIKKWLEGKGVEFEAHKSIFDGKEDLLKAIMEKEREPEEEAEEVEIPVVRPIFMSDAEEARWNAKQEKIAEKKKKKKSGKGKKYPKNVFVFDDLSIELKAPSIVRLLKENRHFKSKVLVSSQSYKDLPPGARGQFQYMLIFRGIRDDVLELIYKESYINVDLDQFLEMYRYATKESYHFLYVDLKSMKFRKDFNEEIVPKKETSDDEE